MNGARGPPWAGGDCLANRFWRSCGARWIAGRPVEIDGLGTFRPTPRQERVYELIPQTRPQVFVAYVEEDLPLARRLRDGIAAAGCATWLDKDKLLPGQDWPRAIRRAVEISDAFVACFSRAVDRQARAVPQRAALGAGVRPAAAAGSDVPGAGAVRAVRGAAADRRAGAVRGPVSGLGGRGEESRAGGQSGARARPDYAGNDRRLQADFKLFKLRIGRMLL